MTERFTVAGIGELLWDVFPHSMRLGGAPANFAFHCYQLGARAYPVSCVGKDELGRRLRDELRGIGVDASHVMTSDTFPTGTVQVTLNDEGKPSYQIVENVAWDHIPFTSELEALATKLDAVCFGSLAQRSAVSRATIRSFLQHMPEEALKIFDVNLRQSFGSREEVERSLQLASILKLSDEELPVLAGYFGLSGDVLAQLEELRERFDLQLVAYTRGADGSVLVRSDEVDDAPGQEGRAVDSVGAGDSFTASLCMGLLEGWPLGKVNLFANRVATFVCSQKGATPTLPDRLISRPTPLTQENLHLLGDEFARPSYDRSGVRAGIVHIGVGGFHRSHEAYFTDALMNDTDASAWGICGVGLREADRTIGDILEAQDHLYTLIVKNPRGKIEASVIGSLIDYMLGCDDPGAVIDKMASADTKIVSLTITEGGYNFDPATGEFDFGNADVQHDLEHPSSPKTVFGFLTAALGKRRSQGLPAFTIQSCDNIQHNGDVTRKMLLSFAHEQDAELARWIEREASFPNAMVDRITPVTTPEDVAYLATELGLKDEWPVTCEPFIQWVIEDNFANGRPAWEKVGAQFVSDVTPYEKMKLRLLNAGHSVLGLLGSIYGHRTIDGCVADPLFATYLRRFMDVEATPVLDPVQGIDLEGYKASLMERFGNPNIKDNLARICLESSAKLPKFLIPTIRENLEQGGSIEFATLTIAAWCFYSDKGVDRHGEPLEIVDAMKDELHRAAKGTQDDPLSFLKLTSIFGDLIREDRFATLYSEMVRDLYDDPDVALRMGKLLSETLSR